MSGFSISVTSPFAAGTFGHGISGPHEGGHQAPNWYIEYGMDLGADAGTAVYAAFDAHITKFQPHVPATDSGKVYGAQLFMRAPNEQMGAFYTHLSDVPEGIGPGSQIALNDYLGTVYSFAGIPPHLHLALVEIIGGAPSGTYQGVNLYDFFLSIADLDVVKSVFFYQDGSAPTPM